MVFYVSKNISDEYRVINSENFFINEQIPVKMEILDFDSAGSTITNKVGSKYNVSLKIFGVVPVGKTKVEIVDEMYVLPLGTPFGMKIYTDGVLVVNISDVDAEEGIKCPADIAGIKVGDFIISINGEKVFTNGDVASIIENSKGNPINVVIKRDNIIKTITIKPLLSKSTQTYKAGIWVRDSSAGIGTLTFFYPYNSTLCGLGHCVADTDTGKILSIGSGQVVKAEIISLVKGKKGTPGELQGRLLNEKYGDICLNSNAGIFCTADKNFETQNLIQIALKQEIKTGQAYIYTTISGNQPKMYECNIKINKKDSNTNQDLIVEVTDKELLATTGGIIQGMSGSPIIQNGKLIGAVTHVFVDDASKGYGIFAEKMLETAQSIENNQNVTKEAS